MGETHHSPSPLSPRPTRGRGRNAPALGGGSGACAMLCIAHLVETARVDRHTGFLRPPCRRSPHSLPSLLRPRPSPGTPHPRVHRPGPGQATLTPRHDPARHVAHGGVCQEKSHVQGKEPRQSRDEETQEGKAQGPRHGEFESGQEHAFHLRKAGQVDPGARTGRRRPGYRPGLSPACPVRPKAARAGPRPGPHPRTPPT